MAQVRDVVGVVGEPLFVSSEGGLVVDGGRVRSIFAVPPTLWGQAQARSQVDHGPELGLYWMMAGLILSLSAASVALFVALAVHWAGWPMLAVCLRAGWALSGKLNR